MKANLMFRDADFDPMVKPCFGYSVLGKDLEIDRIIKEMAQGDDIIHTICTAAVYSPLQSESEIRYRQANLKDALENEAVIRKFYSIITETFKKRKSLWFWLSGEWNLTNAFSSAVDLLRLFTEMLMELRGAADASAGLFKSEGFVNLVKMLQTELNDEYFAEVRGHLDELKSKDGTLISSRLGNYLQGVGYVLRLKERKGFWLRWKLSPSVTVSERDELGLADLANRHGRASNGISIALAQAAEHLENFFGMLRRELAFYMGCINLAESMRSLGMRVCIPEILPSSSNDRAWRGLYNISLAIEKQTAVTGNEMETQGKRLYIVTGANQGGKSTFIRSLGQAQLMAQCGMPVGADMFRAPVRTGVFTHFIKEEDSTMKRGKLDEELARMNKIANNLKAGSLMLFNESFASTNERDGSEICRQITKALVENGVEVFSITHLYTFAAAFTGDAETQFMRAQRLESHERTFKIVPGEPLQTAYGADLYEKIFNSAGNFQS